MCFTLSLMLLGYTTYHKSDIPTDDTHIQKIFKKSRDNSAKYTNHSLYLILGTWLHTYGKDEVTHKQSSGQVEVDKVVNIRKKLLAANKWNWVTTF